MYSPPSRRERRLRIHRRIRGRVLGSSGRPRLSVHRSLKHIYAQLIDDSAGRTLASASTLDKESAVNYGGNVPAAADVGERIAEQAAKAGIQKVIFDRGGHLYHGRVRALAESAREGGLEF